MGLITALQQNSIGLQCYEKGQEWLGVKMHGLRSAGCKIYRQTKENLWKKDSQISQLHKKDAMDCQKSTKDIV